MLEMVTIEESSVILSRQKKKWNLCLFRFYVSFFFIADAALFRAWDSSEI